jgi:aspartate-semialdehyde dehydrogenase
METVAVIGATGAVGQEILRILEERRFPLRNLRCFASPRSAGKSVPFMNEQIPLEALSSLDGVDLSFFCAGSSLSKEWIPKTDGFVVDSSSALRMDPKIPLVIPEINAHTIRGPIAASPNCAATVLLMPLFALHRRFKAKRIVASTYQAASGGGAHLLRELKLETAAHLSNKPYSHALPFPYAFNLYPHNSRLDSSGYVEEEIKMAQETRKILEDASIQVSATCVRVPVLRAHSVSANVEFQRPFDLDEVYRILAQVPGLKLFEDRLNNRFATPVDATGKDEIFCGRFRIDPTQPNTLEFWAVGDQLRKGAALNAVQIGELLSAQTPAQ